MPTATGDFDDNLRALAKRIEDAAFQGLTNLGEHILEESTRLVPIDESTLSASGKTEGNRADLTVGIGYGSGGAKDYAVRQHEDMSLTHDNGRQAKFLEQPFMAARQDGLGIIADPIRQVL